MKDIFDSLDHSIFFDNVSDFGLKLIAKKNKILILILID